MTLNTNCWHVYAQYYINEKVQQTTSVMVLSCFPRYGEFPFGYNSVDVPQQIELMLTHYTSPTGSCIS